MHFVHFQVHNENQSARRSGKCHSHKHQKSSGEFKQGQIQVMFDDSQLEATVTTIIKVKLAEVVNTLMLNVATAKILKIINHRLHRFMYIYI